MSPISKRIRQADAAFAAVRDFYLTSPYGERRLEPGICDFTFGNPHELPLGGLVDAIRTRAVPHDKNWFAYKTSEEEPPPCSPRSISTGKSPTSKLAIWTPSMAVRSTTTLPVAWPPTLDSHG